VQSLPFQVEVTRSGVTESTHLVDVAVVNAQGDLVAHAGDASIKAALRSAAKPLQAKAARELGWEPLDSHSLAIACASHYGEPRHLRAVRHILMNSGLDESALQCPPDWPFRQEHAAITGKRLWVSHNCSGKHAAFLAACQASSTPVSSYLDAENPLQRKVRNIIEQAAGAKAEGELIDGCGAPTLVFELASIARMFSTVHSSVEAEAMMSNPELVAGAGGSDAALLSQNIPAKIGAEGLSCATTLLQGQLIGIALKVRDGAARARAAVLVEIFNQLGLEELVAKIPAEVSAPATLGGGVPVGKIQVRGELIR
jgi:L-asparaginase II